MYSEGCEGGEAPGVAWFGSNFEFIPEDCLPYEQYPGECKYSCKKSKDFPKIK